MMKQVQVLLSSYNGEKWLSAQLDSLAGQNCPGVSVLIRDDGSTDSTLNIVKQYETRISQYFWYAGKNLGIWRSFWNLMQHADPEVEYYAFCDQDDIWFPDKLKRGLEFLQDCPKSLPALYCGALLPVDENLHPLRTTLTRTAFRPSFENAVIQNIATGCTCIFNRVLLELAISVNPRYMVMHDWWMYLLASCFGTVFYDDIPKIYYRQHGGNSIGARTNQLELWKYRLRTFRKNRGKLYRQNEEFLRLYSLPETKGRLLKDFLMTKKNRRKRLEFWKDHRYYRQNRMDDLIYRLVVLVGLA